MTTTETATTFIRKELEYAAKLANEIIKTRTPKPVLQCVKLEIGAETHLYATDLERAISVKINQVQVGTPMTLCIPADKLVAILGKSADEMIRLDLDGDTAVIRCGEGQWEREWRIAMMKVSDFPPMAFEPSGETANIKGKDLAWAISACNVCINTEGKTTGASAQNAIYLIFDGGMKCVGSDGKSLMCVSFGGDGGKFSGMVHYSMLSVVKEMCSAETIQITMDKNRAWISGDDVVYSVALLEGNYFAYEPMLEKKEIITVKASRAQLLSAIESVAVVLALESRKIVWTVLPMQLTLAGGSDSKAKAPIPCQADGEITIGLNPKYLIDLLGLIEDEDITIGLTAPNRPIFLRREGMTFVQMPINLEG